MPCSERTDGPTPPGADALNPPDRGHLATEQRLEGDDGLDALSVEAALGAINQQDAMVPAAVARAIPAITGFLHDLVPRLREGGRLVYAGAGTSGRLGVLDAAECPPTFHCEPGLVDAVIAGGDSALRRSSEGREDDPAGPVEPFEQLDLSPRDMVLAIAAGGTTPWAWGAVRLARQRGCGTGFLCCIPLERAAAVEPVDHLIAVPVGPEVITGSTRMKAATATKLVLNMISTVTMVQLGKTWGNLMVDLRATNAKLRDRGARIIAEQMAMPREQALDLLGRAGGRVKTALVMAHFNVEAAEAERRLEAADGQLRPLLGPPR